MSEPACQLVTTLPPFTGGARLLVPSFPPNSSPLLRARDNVGRIAVDEPTNRHHPAPQGWTHVRLPPCIVVSTVMRRGVSPPLPRSVSSPLPRSVSSPLSRSIPSPGACHRDRQAASSPTHAAGSPSPLTHQGVTSPYYVGRPLSSRGATTMQAPSTWLQGLAQRLCFILLCWHRGWASSRSPPSCLGARRHRAHRVATAAPSLSSSLSRCRRTDKIPTPRVPFTTPIATVLLRRASAHPPCRSTATPSYPIPRTRVLPPVLSYPFPARACCHPCCPIHPPVARVYRPPLPLAYCLCSAVRWSTGEPLAIPLSASATVAVETPSHRLPFLSRRSRSSSGPQTSSATSSSPLSPSARAAPMRSASTPPPSSVCFQASPPCHTGAP
jgi:hypothetical protein